MAGVTVRDARHEDLDTIMRIREQAFFSDEASRAWFRERNGVDGYLLAERDGRVVGTTQIVPLGQYFGGRRLETGAVASVAVEAESRGTGIAPMLMRHAIQKMHADGIALSTLYASTVRLYRGVGFEIAGEGTSTSIPVGALGDLAAGEPRCLRPGDERDVAAIRSCYERVAPARSGWFDRSDVWWRRYRYLPRDGRFLTVFEREGRIDGYSIRAQTLEQSSGRVTFVLEELVAADSLVATTLWRSLGAQSMQASELTVSSVALDELLLLLPEQQGLRPLVSDRWLLRLVDVPGALGGRGYPGAVTARVELEIDDPVVASNAGRFVLDVDDGTAIASGGGAGTTTISIGAFAALYSGWTSATTLARAGILHGDPGAVEALDACFAGPTPSCFDDF